MATQSKIQLKVEQLKSNFIQDCLRGFALLDDIDDYVDQWHKGGTGMPLYAFLGMTQQEYNAWLVEDELLPLIVKAHHDSTSLGEVIQQDYSYAMAARSTGGDKVVRLMQWLQKEGILQ